jgi:hypothetical protein
MKDEANMDVTIVIQVIVLAIYIHYQQGKWQHFECEGLWQDIEVYYSNVQKEW